MKNVTTTIVLASALLSVAACGNKDSSSSPKKSGTDNLIIKEGHYQATFASLNSHVAGDVTGTAMVKVKGDAMTFEVKVNGAPAQIMHAQSIHVSSECPTLAADANNDGVIDGVEGQKSYGAVVVPLDNNLKTQVEKDAKFPSADFSGNYFYRQNVSMMEMMTDLTAKDNDLTDNVVKIKSALNLEGRQIVIYGVPASADLPESAAGINGQTKFASLPIACGSFVKIAVDEGPTSSGGKEE